MISLTRIKLWSMYIPICYRNNFLQRSVHIGCWSPFIWYLVLCALFVWVIIYLILLRGSASFVKVCSYYLVSHKNIVINIVIFIILTTWKVGCSVAPVSSVFYFDHILVQAVSWYFSSWFCTFVLLLPSFSIPMIFFKDGFSVFFFYIKNYLFLVFIVFLFKTHKYFPTAFIHICYFQTKILVLLCTNICRNSVFSLLCI